ncbi:hypothetical protein KP509_34G049200 [Ceratopteris richardii]|uniref:Uncharacterized protein n=1 Tax=Ceratopteris richardii TaxID=49495 RepID=A0A8T2QJK7_CERRI|nr:hypothetical protein KP509_34G049200 [Ceratopteris richardii]
MNVGLLEQGKLSSIMNVLECISYLQELRYHYPVLPSITLCTKSSLDVSIMGAGWLRDDINELLITVGEGNKWSSHAVCLNGNSSLIHGFCFLHHTKVNLQGNVAHLNRKRFTNNFSQRLRSLYALSTSHHRVEACISCEMHEIVLMNDFDEIWENYGRICILHSLIVMAKLYMS